MAIISACTREEMPKILALGFVNGGAELSVLDLNNGSREYITNSKVITPTSFSYCNAKKEIAYSAFVEDGEELILWEINYNTYALTKGNNKYKFPVWSRDCLYIAFNSSNQSVTRVYILNMQDKAVHPLIANEEITSEGASWSPDSSLIVTHLPTVDSLGQKSGYNLGIVDTENRNLVKELSGPIDFPFSKPAWENNGQFFLYSAREGSTFDIFKYDINLETAILTIGSEKDDRFPVMSPDGKRFVFLQSEPGQTIFRIGLFDNSLQSTTYLSDFQQSISSLLWVNNEQVIYSKYDPGMNKTSLYLVNINEEKEIKLGDWDGQYLNLITFP